MFGLPVVRIQWDIKFFFYPSHETMGISITFDVSGGVAWESYLSTSIFIHALALAIDIRYIYMVSITLVLIYLFLSIFSISCAMCTYLLLNNVSTLLTRNLVPRHSHHKVDQVTIPHF